MRGIAMVTILSSYKQNTMVSTPNVLLLTLNKALPGGRLRITRFVLIPISLWIKLNHSSCFLYLFLYALVWICSMQHIHRLFKLSVVLKLKKVFFSQTDMVSSLIDVPRVHAGKDIGCICGLTPAGNSPIPNGWVVDLNSNGKVSQGSGLMLHSILMSLQP